MPIPAKDLLTVLTCSSVLEADRAVKQLEAAGITAFIPNKLEILTRAFADLRNSYADIRIQVPKCDYDTAKNLLQKS